MELKTTKEMTHLLRISRNTFKRLIRDRNIPVIRVGRQSRFDLALVMKTLQGGSS